LVRLPRRIPSAVALELVVTGDAVDAGRLHALGLVNRLTDEGGALEEALGFAAAIARNAPLAVATAKRVIVEQADWPASEVWDRQRADTARVQTSVDAREGAVAFLEKRDPVWQGC
jgi:enoyl-CoA hydratase